MKNKATDILRFLVLITAVMFFGTGFWLIVKDITSGAARWLFDFLSAFLVIFIFFWLFLLEESLRQEN